MKKKLLIISTCAVIILAAVLVCIGLLYGSKDSPIISENSSVFKNGDVVYIPAEKALSYDENENIFYYNNLLVVYLFSDLSDKETQKLADLIDGEVVGDISGCINFVQIEVKESSLAQLNEMAAELNRSKNVLYATYDVPMPVDGAVADSNPWSEDPSEPDQTRSNESDPDGNDWWAEAIGAYTAWEYVDSHTDELAPEKVGVIDSGFYTEHEDLRAKIEILNSGNITVDKNGDANDHGTHVSGIIAAENNALGVRGVADRVSLVCADYSLFDESGNVIWMITTGEYVELVKQMIESDCKVINCSFGCTLWTIERVKKILIDQTLEDFSGGSISWIADELRNFALLDEEEYNYENWLQYYKSEARNTSVRSLSLIIELLLNGEDQFLFVQSAGNGYDNNLSAGYDAEHTGFFCGVSVDLFNSLSNVSTKLGQLGIDYDKIDEHILVVGSVQKRTGSESTYRTCAWSCFGNQVDIWAPGEDIFGLSIVENGESKYISAPGTSLSAPMVSGAAALLWQINPDLTSAEVRQYLLNSPVRAVAAEGDSGNTFPVLNIGAAVKKLTENDSLDVTPVFASGNGAMNNYLQIDPIFAFSDDWVYFNNAGIRDRVSRQGLAVEQMATGAVATVDGLIFGDVLFNRNGTVFQLDGDETGTCFCDAAFGEFVTNILPHEGIYYYLHDSTIRSAEIYKVVELPGREYTYNGVTYHVSELHGSTPVFDDAEIEAFGIYGDYIVAIDSDDCIWTIDLATDDAIKVYDGKTANQTAIRIVAAVDGEYIYYNNEKSLELERVKFDGSGRDTGLLKLDGRHHSTFNVSDGLLFYMAHSPGGDGYGIYRFSDAGTITIAEGEEQGVQFAAVESLCLIDDWVYYGTVEYGFWRAKTDGTKVEQIVEYGGSASQPSQSNSDYGFEGEWIIDEELDEASMAFLFGPSYSDYGAKMGISNDGTFFYFIGADIGGEGVWQKSTDGINYSCQKYKDGSQEEGSLSIVTSDKGYSVFVMPFEQYVILWKPIGQQSELPDNQGENSQNNGADTYLKQLIGKWICDEGSIRFSENGTCYVKMNGSTITEGGEYSIVDEDTLIINEPGMNPYEVDFQLNGDELILGGITFIRE